MFKIFKSKDTTEEISIDIDRIPKHIAIIMDGNGRWAKARMLPRTMGHKAGVETIRRILKEADSLGIKYLTLYAFSTENWKRPKDEVTALMRLLIEYLNKEMFALNENDVKLRLLGNLEGVQTDVANKIQEALELTKDNEGVNLCIAFNYGGRDEIVKGIKDLACDVKTGKVDPNSIKEDLFENYLYTKDIPDPELIIRPSGEQRISNFLLWQCAYSEFWYTNICWPDFNEDHLHKAIYDYQNRDRRFGGV